MPCPIKLDDEETLKIIIFWREYNYILEEVLCVGGGGDPKEYYICKAA